MKKNARGLAKELKKLLLNSAEDEFLTTGAKAPAVFPARKTPKAEPRVKQPVPAAEKPAVETPAVNIEIPRAVAEASADKAVEMEKINKEILACRKCPLGAARLNAVPGEGNLNARIFFVGEGPGFDEDHSGRPFIGRAGQLLTKIIESTGLKREDVFIGNIAKCHPMIDPSNPEKHGNDRAPDASEIAACRSYVERQIALVNPEVVVALGGVAAKTLILDAKSLGALRGQFFGLELDFAQLKRPVKIMATYHPAALLRNPGWKKDAWTDMKMLMKELSLPIPSKTV